MEKKPKIADRPCVCGGVLRYQGSYEMPCLPYASINPLLCKSILYDLYVCDACREVKLYLTEDLKIPDPQEELERRYRTYSAKKLQKITEDDSYREDARQLARRLLKEKETEE